MNKFEVGHGAICIKKTHEHNVGDVLLVKEIDTPLGLRFSRYKTYWNPDNFVPCPNPPRSNYRERIAHALGADLEFEVRAGLWYKISNPTFLKSHDYRVAIPDINSEKRAKLKAEIEKLQNELNSLGGEL